MPFTYNVATDRGKVRLLITDVDSANAIFQDDEIDAFLAMEGESVRYAAASALETIASSEVLTHKVIQIDGLRTDGAAVARELRLRAAGLRAAEDTDDSFDWAEMVTGDFSERERIWAQAQRTLA